MLQTTHNIEDAESMAWDLEGGTEKGDQRKENNRCKNQTKENQHIHNWSPEENQRIGTEKDLKVSSRNDWRNKSYIYRMDQRPR